MTTGVQSDPARATGAAPTLRDLLLYRWCDQLSEPLIYFAVVFSPWAFGTAPHWAIQIMNVAGYLLGLLLAGKYFARWRGYVPDRWEKLERTSDYRMPRLLTILLAIATVGVLAYCLVAGLNARSAYDWSKANFTYHNYLPWLPHSYDRDRSLQCFANYLAIGCIFWAVRDWLLGKTTGEARAARVGESAFSPKLLIPGRLRRLLWVLCLNGSLIGIEAIIQRLSGTTRPLWILDLKVYHLNLNNHPEDQFGPYAYRGNAAQYFNMLWPVALGFWWVLRREGRKAKASGKQLFQRSWRHLLLPCILLLAACPVLAGSRAGAFIAIAGLVMAGIILGFAVRHSHPATRFGMLLFLGLALAIGLYFGSDLLAERLKDTATSFVQRNSLYSTAREIARDYPVFGTGPGSFETVYQLYLATPDAYWPAQLHNDWLETRLTFGWVGSALIALAFVCALLRWFFPGGLHGGWRFVSFLWLALATCLIHARYDFPMQIYSTLLLFVLICAILFTLSSRRSV